MATPFAHAYPTKPSLSFQPLSVHFQLTAHTRYGVLATGLIVGLVWGLWHMPLFLATARASQTVPPILMLVVQLFSFLPAFRVLMVWVYDRTGSLLVAMLMHMSLTATTLIFAISAADTQTVVSDLAYAAALWLFVALIARANRGRLDKV